MIGEIHRGAYGSMPNRSFADQGRLLGGRDMGRRGGEFGEQFSTQEDKYTGPVWERAWLM